MGKLSDEQLPDGQFPRESNFHWVNFLKGKIPSTHKKSSANFFSGLKLNHQNTEKSKFENGVSICVRIYYERLGQPSKIIHHQIDYLLWLSMQYQETILTFAGIDMFLYQPEDDNFIIWATNRWHHICLSFDKQKLFLKVVKDGKITSVNHTNEKFDVSNLNENFTDGLYFGGIPWEPSDTYKQITDVNVWDYSLSIEEMENWSSCK